MLFAICFRVLPPAGHMAIIMTASALWVEQQWVDCDKDRDANFLLPGEDTAGRSGASRLSAGLVITTSL